jgi:DinB superfamily
VKNIERLSQGGVVSQSLGPLKKELVKQLRGGNAHAKFEDATAKMPAELRGKLVKGLPYSTWQQLEHIRIAQRDMLDYCRNSDGSYKEMKWPDAYWPKSAEPPNAKAWDVSVSNFLSDREEFIALIEADDADLFTPFPWGQGQTLLHEAMLIVDHNGYHLGEIVALRRLLGAWK